MKNLKSLFMIVCILTLSACGRNTQQSVQSINPTEIPPAADTPSAASTNVQPAGPALTTARGKIKHIVIIMQENRSFDTYFGTYPGADGLPAHNGKFTVCVNDPATGKCVYPFHDTADLNLGGPHGAKPAAADINGGKMDGFIAQAEQSKPGCQLTHRPECGAEGAREIMGYHDAREIPNYWTLAKTFVLQDHLFEPNASWSLPQHLFMVSEWSARCRTAGDPMSCINELDRPANPKDFAPLLNLPNPDYAWTDLTYLLFKNQVSWKYYVQTGIQPD
jgi:phospholipase C